MKRVDVEFVRPARILLTVCLIAGTVPAWGQRANPASAAGRHPARSQSPNPYGDADHRATPLTLGDVSWTAQPVVEREPIEIHDLITVLVDEKTRIVIEGEIDRRKKVSHEVSLKDWVLLNGLSLIPDPQSRGDPTVAGDVNKKYRAEGEMETSESVKLNIQCEVVDILPNGLLRLEGRTSFQINSEGSEIYFFGTFRPEDILPDNSVESRHVFSQRLVKRETGAVRDGYRRGWLQNLLDRYQL